MGMPPQALEQLLAQQGGGGMPQPGMEPPMEPPMPEQGMEEMTPPMPEPMDPQLSVDNYMDAARMDNNLAKKYRNKQVDGGTLLLDKIGEDIVRSYNDDQASRATWLAENVGWLEMATLIKKTKSFPWKNASNVRYPMLATAAMQFSARAYPALVPSDGKVVKAKVIPYDPTGQLATKAEHVARHMSYQIMCKMPQWEEDMDKLLMTMSISGVAFKKTYYSAIDGYNCSHIIYPEDFVVNYWAKSLDKAYYKGDILYYNHNELREKIRNNEEFLDVDLQEAPAVPDMPQWPDQEGHSVPPSNKATPHQFYSCHTFWDLDNDGYEEPVIITVHLLTKKVVRIIARWDNQGVIRGEDGKKIIKITPVEYFTDIPFIPNPDGSIYALGFGRLLGPLNDSADTLINQLVDAGTLNNLQAGFIAKGLRLKMGIAPFAPGEWRAVPASVEDLNKGIVPLPSKEPSAVLMNLLQMLITSGNQLASIAEIFVGKTPGQNTPATTTQETVKQGMAVFTAVYKRVYRSLYKEFKKLHRLNRLNPGIVEEESAILGVPLQESDYADENYIIPGADPTGDSETTKHAKVDRVGQMLELGTIDRMAFTDWALQSIEIPNYQKLMMQPQPPPPDPKMETEKAKVATMQQKAQLDMAKGQQDMQIAQQKAAMEAQAMQRKEEHETTMQALKAQGAQMQEQMNMMKLVLEQRSDAQKMQHDRQQTIVETEQAMQHAEAEHNQKLAHKEQDAAQKRKEAKAKPKATKK